MNCSGESISSICESLFPSFGYESQLCYTCSRWSHSERDSSSSFLIDCFSSLESTLFFLRCHSQSHVFEYTSPELFFTIVLLPFVQKDWCITSTHPLHFQNKYRKNTEKITEANLCQILSAENPQPVTPTPPVHQSNLGRRLAALTFNQRRETNRKKLSCNKLMQLLPYRCLLSNHYISALFVVFRWILQNAKQICRNFMSYMKGAWD